MLTFFLNLCVIELSQLYIGHSLLAEIGRIVGIFSGHLTAETPVGAYCVLRRARSVPSTAGVSSFVDLDKWMCFYTNRTMDAAAKCVSTVINVARNFGMRIAEPRKVLVQDDRVQAYVQALEQNFNDEAKLMLCMIPSKDKTKYDAIKQLLCLRRPKPSQVVTARLIQTNKNTLGVATKIALQINCKLGGVPWEVRIPMKTTMIVGYDTYHESQHKGASAGAWVASMNPPASRYFSLATIHKDREEICSHMQTNMMREYRPPAVHTLNQLRPLMQIVDAVLSHLYQCIYIKTDIRTLVNK